MLFFFWLFHAKTSDCDRRHSRRSSRDQRHSRYRERTHILHSKRRDTREPSFIGPAACATHVTIASAIQCATRIAATPAPDPPPPDSHVTPPAACGARAPWTVAWYAPETAAAERVSCKPNSSFRVRT